MGRLLHVYRWYLLGAAAIVAFVLGYLGLQEYWAVKAADAVAQALAAHTAPGPDTLPPTATDLANQTLKLFVLNNADLTNVPLSLDIARFLAPAVFGWASLTAFAAVFRDRVQQIRIRFMRGHVVICGLGYVGSVFMHSIRDADEPVVVIESDASNPNIDLCRRSGVPVIVGDARLEETLQAAGLRHASRVMAVCDWDGINTEIVSIARKLAGDRKGPLLWFKRGRVRPLHCVARITDPELCQVIRIEEAANTDPSATVDFFNTDDVSARRLLDRFPFDTRSAQPHILIAHLEELGSALARHAAWDWYQERGPEVSTPLRITVVDDDADRRITMLKASHPALDKVCEFEPFHPSGSGLQQLTELLAAGPPLSRAYVTAYRDEQAIETALRLRHELPGDEILVLSLSRAHGVARLVDDAKKVGLASRVSVFRTLAQTCTIELVRGGSFESIAQAIHRNYNVTRLAQDADAHVVDWDELTDTLKESNREQARDIPRKLAMIGYEIAPLRDWEAASFTFEPGEIDLLAAEEHRRFMVERRDAPAPENAARYAEEFDKLPDDIKERDRTTVTSIPTIIASVGLQMRRKTS